MSQVPPNFERSYSFTDFSTYTPNLQQPGNKIDQELNNASTSLNAIISRLSEIQADDGHLRSSGFNFSEIFTGLSSQLLSTFGTLYSPTFTGNPQAPTPATSDNDTSIATTAFVKNQGYDTSISVNAKLAAALVSPVFTGDPKAPTAPNGDADLSIANTQFVNNYFLKLTGGALSGNLVMSPRSGDDATLTLSNGSISMSGTGLMEGNQTGGTRSFSFDGTGLSFSNFQEPYTGEEHEVPDQDEQQLTVTLDHFKLNINNKFVIDNEHGLKFPDTSIQQSAALQLNTGGVVNGHTQFTSGITSDQSIIFPTDGTNDAELGPWGLGVENTNHDFTTVEPNLVGLHKNIGNDGNGNPVMKGLTITADGIRFPDNTLQVTAVTAPDPAVWATNSSVDTKLAGLVNSSPSTLDTLGELATALGNDANFATTVTNSIATKLSIASAASTYQPISGMSSYLTTSTAAATYAPISSPTFTGTPLAPTASTSTNTTQIATTAFVKAQAYAPLSSPTFTGTPSAPTATTTDNSTKIATTAFVKSALSSNSASFYTQGKNITGATLPAFAVVYITGTNSNLPTWGLAKADSSATSDKTFGVLINAITNNGTGVATTAGMISNINTAAWTVGTPIWLSATTAGGLTSTRPSSPNHSVYIGIVITQNSSSGQIFVRIQNGYQLEDLHNVTITSPANNHSLFYDSATSTWVNRANDLSTITSGEYSFGVNGFKWLNSEDPPTAGLTVNSTGIFYDFDSQDKHFNLNFNSVSGSSGGDDNKWLLSQHGVYCVDDAASFQLTKDGVNAGSGWSLDENGVSGLDNSWRFGSTGASTAGQINIAYSGYQAQASSSAYYAYQTNNGTNPQSYGVVYTGGFEAADGAGQWIEFTPTQLRFGDGTIQTTAATGGGSGDYLPLAGGTMTGNITFDGTSGQYIGKGSFDTSRGGNYGLSLVCSIGYEFNWQAGWLTTTNQSSTTPRSLYLDSLAGTTLKVWDSSNNTGIDVSHTEITFADTTTQSTAGLPLTGGTMANDASIVSVSTSEYGNYTTTITGNSVSCFDPNNNTTTSISGGGLVWGSGYTSYDSGIFSENFTTNDDAGSHFTVSSYEGIVLTGTASSIKFGDNSIQTTAAISPPEDGDGYSQAYNNNGNWTNSPIFSNVTLDGELRLNADTPGSLTFDNRSDKIKIFPDNIQFADGSTQTTAAVVDEAPIDGNYYVRKDGAWVQCTVYTLLGKNYLTV